MDMVAKLGPWYQCIELPGGVKTSADPRPLGTYTVLAEHGRLAQYQNVLDLGANACWWGIQLARTGAHTVAVEQDAQSLAQARFAIDQLGLHDKIDLVAQDLGRYCAPLDVFDCALLIRVL